MSKTKQYLCCIFNYAPHYRLPIYKLIDEEFPTHFYFGDKLNKEQIEKFEYSELKGYQKELRVKFIDTPLFSIEYTKGWLSLAFSRNYKKYLITPNQFAINQWIFLIICFFLKKEVYVWMHGIKSSKISRVILLVDRLYDCFLKGSFLYGNYSKKNMIRLNFEESKLHVIYNSLDYKKSCCIRNRKLINPYLSQFKNSNPILLFIGRLTKVKKLDMLIDAYRLLKHNGIHTNVIFIGDGPERKNLESLIEEVDKSHFWFTGSLYCEEQIAKYLYHADLCISPGNVGLTAIHALTYGLPVITNDCFDLQMPEFEAIERGVSGDFFKEGDIDDLVKKIENWLGVNKQREEVRVNCFKIVDTKYNPYNQVQIFKKIISNI